MYVALSSHAYTFPATQASVRRTMGVVSEKNIINSKQKRIALRITTSDYCHCVPFNVSLDSGSRNEEATVKRRLLLSLLLGLVLVSSAACTGKQTTTQQLVKVTRGDIAVTVSGSGNLEVANDATPTFRIGGG